MTARVREWLRGIEGEAEKSKSRKVEITASSEVSDGASGTYECTNAYAALARLLRCPGIRAAIVCVDGLAEEEFAFFRWGQRHRPDVRFFAYTDRNDHEGMQFAMRHGVRALDVERLGEVVGIEGKVETSKRRKVEIANDEAFPAGRERSCGGIGDEATKGWSDEGEGGARRGDRTAGELQVASYEIGGGAVAEAERTDRRKVVAQASRPHNEVPLIGSEGIDSSVESEDEGFEPTHTWPFRVCGLTEDDENGVAEEGVEEAAERESAEATGKTAGGEQEIAADEATGGEAAADELLEQREDEREEEAAAGPGEGQEDLRGPVRVPWLRYSDAPRRSKPGESEGIKGSRDQGIEGNVEKSKSRKVEIASDEAIPARREPSDEGGPGEVARSKSQEVEATRAEGTEGQRDEGDQAKIETSKSQKVEIGSDDTRHRGSGIGDQGKAQLTRNDEWGGRMEGEPSAPPPLLPRGVPLPSGEGGLPAEYYEPLLTQAELMALMSDEDIELRDEERDALIGRDQGIEESRNQGQEATERRSDGAT